MQFFLGTHEISWLRICTLPLFISARRLRRAKKRMPIARCDWCLDSGGFSELSLYGKFVTSPEAYACQADRWKWKIGRMVWACPQDWMCEPFMLAKTGLTVANHQRLTIESFAYLRCKSPSVNWIPILQGWSVAEYIAHARQYEQNGFDLAKFPVVGIGSVCRRQATEQAIEIIREVSSIGIRLHGFGFKITAFENGACKYLASADSLAWSYDARMSAKLPGCGHSKCNNCIVYAEKWRKKVLNTIRCHN